MLYETAEMKSNRSIQAIINEMKSLPTGVKSVIDDYGKGTRTLVYKDGRHETRNMNGSSVKSSAKTSAKLTGKTAAEVKASLQKTMREADQSISDFTKRIALLDIEINRLTMHGKYTATEQRKRDDLVQRIGRLKAIKSRCAVLLGGT